MVTCLSDCFLQYSMWIARKFLSFQFNNTEWASTTSHHGSMCLNNTLKQTMLHITIELYVHTVQWQHSSNHHMARMEFPHYLAWAMYKLHTLSLYVHQWSKVGGTGQWARVMPSIALLTILSSAFLVAQMGCWSTTCDHFTVWGQCAKVKDHSGLTFPTR